MQKQLNLILFHIKLDKLYLLADTIDYIILFTNSSDLQVAGWFA